MNPYKLLGIIILAGQLYLSFATQQPNEPTRNEQNTSGAKLGKPTDQIFRSIGAERSKEKDKPEPCKTEQFCDSIWNPAKHPVVSVSKTSTNRAYEFYSDRLSYDASVEVCRQSGSHLLSLESRREQELIDNYLAVYRSDIFKGGTPFIWTGGYFDLQSDNPTHLRWMDQTNTVDNNTIKYHRFCPEIDDIQTLIGKALAAMKAEKNTTSKSDHRRLIHVLLEHTEIGSCWAAIQGSGVNDLKFPFVCKV